MLINMREYFRPKDLAEAQRLLAAGQGRFRVLAGGTHLVGSGDPAVEGVVDIARLGLDEIRSSDEGIHLGATATLQQLIDSPLIRQYERGIVCQAALSRTVSKMVRNAATLGGELAVRDPFSALAAVLLALDARIELFDSQRRLLPAADFFAAGHEVLARPAILLGVELPRREAGSGSNMQRLATLTSSPPLLCVATSVVRQGERAERVRIALSGGFASPSRIPAMERAVEGRAVDENELKQMLEAMGPLLDPPLDLQATSEYRRQVAPVLVRRSLLAAWEPNGRKRKL